MADPGRAEPPPADAAAALQGVSQTLLWTLYHRALEARRDDAVLHDPWAVELVDALDYPFEQRFGRDLPSAQSQALRVRTFDEQIRRFLLANPQGTVVALGEGLETQFWRVDNGRVRWLSVDLPEILALRARLLPAPDRVRTVAGRAQDLAWMDHVDDSRPVLVTAQGLLMYLPPPQVRDLLAACARRLPGHAMVFDTVPRWVSARTVAGTMRIAGGYRPPPMPWGMDADQRHLVRTAHPNIVEVRELRIPRGRGVLFGALLPLLPYLPVLGGTRVSVLLVRFGRAGG